MKIKTSFLVLLFGIVLNVNGQVSTDSLVGYWPFNGNANDMSINNNNAIINTAVLTTDRNGNPDKAYSFNGTDSKIILDTSNLNIHNQLSITCWINTTAEKDNFIISKYNWRVDKGYHLLIMDDGFAAINGRDSNGEYTQCVDSSNIINDGNWHFLTGIINFNVWELYVDGILQKEVTTEHSYVDLTTKMPLTIGFHDVIDSPEDVYYNGTIDDVRIYNRALDSAEVLELYNEIICTETIYDTTYITICDTNKIEVFDTTYVIINDTNRVEIFDTTYVTIVDSISVTDTLIIDVALTDLSSADNINTIKVFPNPTNDILYINTGDNYEQITSYKLKIINMSGSTVFESYIIEQLFEINMNNFGDTGLFFIQIIDDSNNIIDIRKLLLH